MKILALDSSTLTGSAAVVDGGAVLAESACRVRATHSEQLLPLVREVLARAECPLDAIDRIAVGVGPGSFTGVRIGVATAKGLAVATGIPLFGVGSLDALAEAAWSMDHGVLVAAIDARRAELYATAWRVVGGARAVLLPPCNERPEAVGAALADVVRDGDAVWVVGDAREADLEVVASALPVPLRRAPAVCAAPLARYVAWAAMHGRGALDDGHMEPRYVRGSDAKLPRGVAP